MTLIAHISDLHIDAQPRSLDRARAAMDYLECLPVDLDAVVVTGDIADHGLTEEYATARKLLTSRHPVLVTAGNHDTRTAFREFLLDEPASGAPINRLHRGTGFVVALCDSSIPGRDDGFLEDETLTWLEETLASTSPDVPVLVGFHHPPTSLHTPYVDDIRLFATDRLAALADRHEHLVAFLVGHAHTAAVSTFAGRPVLVAPGVVSTLRIPWEPRAHADPHFHTDLPPVIAFHVLDDDRRITTHYRVVPA